MQNSIFDKPNETVAKRFFFSRLVGGAKIIDASDRRFYAFAMLSSDGAAEESRESIHVELVVVHEAFRRIHWWIFTRGKAHNWAEIYWSI